MKLERHHYLENGAVIVVRLFDPACMIRRYTVCAFQLEAQVIYQIKHRFLTK
jgi:hypothetical protein